MQDVSRPEAKVLGVYLPVLSPDRFEEHIQKYVKSCDPKNFDEETIAVLKRFGRDVSPLPQEELIELEEDFRDLLGGVACFEVLISNVDSNFNASDFLLEDQGRPRSQWQAAWQDTYLSEDGEEVLPGFSSTKAPDGPTIRMQFYVHYWTPELILQSSYGPLTCPPPGPMTERLWRLIPYEPYD